MNCSTYARQRWTLLVVCTLMLMLAGCAGPAPERLERRERPEQIVATAQDELATLNSPLDWITGASELSSAYLELQQPARAIALLSAGSGRVLQIAEPAQQADAHTQLLGVAALVDRAAHAGFGELRDHWFSRAYEVAQQVESLDKRWDYVGKLAVAQAASGDIAGALAMANQIPADNAMRESLKARALHEIVPLQAASGDFSGAAATLDGMRVGLVYYRAVARSYAAVIAADAGRIEWRDRWFSEGEELARGQQDGYFLAGGMRRLASAFDSLGQSERALEAFRVARAGTAQALTDQHRARALGRIATALADAGRFELAGDVLEEAVPIAQAVTSEPLRYYAHYELAGAAAFSQNYTKAAELLDVIPADFKLGGRDLRAAVQRDIAWGYARNGETSRALEVAQQIEPARERVQALCRIARVLHRPEMHALPRYL